MITLMEQRLLSVVKEYRQSLAALHDREAGFGTAIVDEGETRAKDVLVRGVLAVVQTTPGVLVEIDVERNNAQRRPV